MREAELVVFLSWLRWQPGVVLGDLDNWKAAEEFRAFLEAYAVDDGRKPWYMTGHDPSIPTHTEEHKEQHRRDGAAGITYEVRYVDASIR